MPETIVMGQAPAPVAPAAAPAAGPAPTAPAAPAAPPTPIALSGAPAPAAPAPDAPAEPAPAEGTAIEYEVTGDVGLDMALGFIGRQGLGPESPAVAAAMNGDFSLLRAELAGRGAKAQGWEQFIALAEKAYTDTKTQNDERSAKDREAIYGSVGGEQQWAAIQAWASANAEADEKAEVNAALAAGGRQARAMAVYLAQLYSKASGTTVTPENPLSPNAASAAPTNGALSPRAYTEAVRTLHREIGPRMEDSREYAQLQARRAAWRG